MSSCGCFVTEFNVARNTTHGLSSTPEYGVWCKMKARCEDPAEPSYRYYGARGITVCERWRNDYAAFYTDMGARPTPAHQIDRTDNDGPYSSENCRWRTRTEQANNKRNNTRLVLNGETHTIAEWARLRGLTSTMICLRLYRRGWPVERALTTPANASKHAYLTLDGARRSIAEWSALTGIKTSTLHERLRHGWSVERALTAPVR